MKCEPFVCAHLHFVRKGHYGYKHFCSFPPVFLRSIHLPGEHWPHLLRLSVPWPDVLSRAGGLIWAAAKFSHLGPSANQRSGRREPRHCGNMKLSPPGQPPMGQRADVPAVPRPWTVAWFTPQSSPRARLRLRPPGACICPAFSPCHIPLPWLFRALLKAPPRSGCPGLNIPSSASRELRPRREVLLPGGPLTYPPRSSLLPPRTSLIHTLVNLFDVFFSLCVLRCAVARS